MADDQRATVAALFDRVADVYDRVDVDLFGPVADQLVAELAPVPGERALDIGCGRGAVLFRLAEGVGSGGAAVGIDLSPGMVAATRAEAEAAGRAVEVRVADAQEPDLDPASFDLIASSLVLFFLPDPASALARWRDLLAPGGRIGVSTFGSYGEAWKHVDAVFAPYMPPQMADPRTQAADSPFASDAGVERLLTDAGFNGVRTVTSTVEVRFRDEAHWERWTWSVGMRRMWEAVPDAERDAVRSTAFERLDACRDRDGRIGFDQGVRFTLADR